eukprot:CAMPEP_0172479572 /NCGR_PEP_ID=MMETSP1066-20121228/4266_1 /TAXON_ID=671091 /ORGANISM="Coscinodiscus wailesii, Strain CCMP2513" /LENGTH=54 /DNA_ID=CAMNT_0013240175 /DNA_START=1 /DNA_END=161 /DNA_ORIENTATION=-
MMKLHIVPLPPKNNEQKEKYIDDENDFLQGFDYGDVTSLKLILTEAPLIDTEAA